MTGIHPATLVRQHRATITIAALCLVAYAAEALRVHALVDIVPSGGPVPPLVVRFGLLGAGIQHGELYRLVTGGFLHSGLIHLGVNLVGLGIAGAVLERRLGACRFLMVFTVGSLIGNLAAAATAGPTTVVIGASAGILGLFGTVGAHALLAGVTREVRLAVVAVTGILLVGVLHGDMSNPGHIVGSAAGLLCGLVLRPPALPELPEPERIALISAGGALQLRLDSRGITLVGELGAGFAPLAWDEVSSFFLRYADGVTLACWRSRAAHVSDGALPLARSVDAAAVVAELEAWRLRSLTGGEMSRRAFATSCPPQPRSASASLTCR